MAIGDSDSDGFNPLSFLPRASTGILALDVVVLLAAFVLAATIYRKRANPTGLPYPPGPKPSKIPFVGNIPDMPSSDGWLTFTKWGQEYGPIVMINIMGQRICIINSAKVATDLLDTRSSIYSDRPAMPMVKELMGWDFNVGFQPYGTPYTKARKLFHHGFNAHASEQYVPIQTREILLSLGKMLQTPDKFDEILRTTTGAIIMKIAFGYQTKENDEFVRIAEEAQLAMSFAARPGAYLVDFIPLLKYVPEWFPGAGFKRVAREGWELAQELQNKPFAWAKQQLAEGKAQPSFFTALMDTKGLAITDSAEQQKMIQGACAVMYATGTDTIQASVLTFFLAMLHAPHVQLKAQEELARVIGNDRLPVLEDREALPYITAITKETYRWELVTPIGVPHRLMEDDIYEGYFIPKGTTVIANQWGMSHDESMYPNSMEFRPERFLGVPDVKDGGPRDPNTIAFGWGRRICPGRFMAENSLWLHIAMTLACFSITPVIGPDGEVIIPPRQYTSSLACRPKPFPCKITSRNAAAVELIKHSIAALED